MASFREAGPDAKSRLAKTSKGFQQRQAYRDNLGTLSEGQLLEVVPDQGESLRKLKVNVRRAANELNINVNYGDTTEGTLLVWTESGGGRRGRGRGRKAGDGAGG